MNYKTIIFILFIYLNSCANQPKIVDTTKKFEFYSNKGFTLIYDDDLFKKKIINKKIDNKLLVVFNNNLKKNTPVKITNLLNGKNLLAKVGSNLNYPLFYNSVISEKIANELELESFEPYIQIQTVNSKNIFIANKAKTFDEEKKVANNAPVEVITIKNLGTTKLNIKKNISKKTKNFNYIIKFADLYFESSATVLQKRLKDEFNINDVNIKMLSKNSFRVYKGPFKNLESIKKEFIDIKSLDFENIEIIKL
tara:strand:- start:3985 stop:4740 length:756 start_codon:yes stop_codon:yes gene_type:complete